MLGFGLLFLVLGLFGLLATAFWIWMLIDDLAYQEKDKVMWLLVLLFIPGLGSLLYYFLGRDRRKKDARLVVENKGV